MWQNEEDEDGQPVTRSFGVPSTHVAYFKYNGNGNPEGTYLVGEFDENGLPMPVESKPQSIRQRTLYSSTATLFWPGVDINRGITELLVAGRGFEPLAFKVMSL